MVIDQKLHLKIKEAVGNLSKACEAVLASIESGKIAFQNFNVGLRTQNIDYGKAKTITPKHWQQNKTPWRR